MVDVFVRAGDVGDTGVRVGGCVGRDASRADSRSIAVVVMPRSGGKNRTRGGPKRGK